MGQSPIPLFTDKGNSGVSQVHKNSSAASTKVILLSQDATKNANAMIAKTLVTITRILTHESDVCAANGTHYS